MSSSFEMPQILEPMPVTAMDHAPNRLQELVATTKRAIGRTALVLGLVSGPTIAMAAHEIATPEVAEAAAFDNDYPNQGAIEYNKSTYDWWVDENGNGKPDVTASTTDNDETMSSRGYFYRNCTDGAAYWTQKYTGVGVSGWGNANNWNEKAAATGRQVYTKHLDLHQTLRAQPA